jgi:hypothetical protein
MEAVTKENFACVAMDNWKNYVECVMKIEEEIWKADES